MKLRPTAADRKAIDKLKKHYDEATATKAILRAVRDVPGMQSDIRAMESTIRTMTAILQKIDSGSGIMLGSLAAIKEYCNGLPE